MAKGEPRRKAGRKPEAQPSAGGWSPADEPFVFPAEPEPAGPGGGRISLPSSGLAADILGRAESGLVAQEPEAAPAAAASLDADERSAQRVHNISFFAAPAREEKVAAEAQEHLVTFFLTGEEYGVDVRLVQEIIRVTEITQVPRAPEFIKGVINLRGRIIPVIDLKRKLGLGEVAIERQTRVVVIRLRERLIGLLVDGASQVLKVPVSTIEAAPEEVVEIDANYIRGVAKLDDRLIILVDLPKILGLERDAALQLPSA
jgi:purine-binding chemotaxis protein CheW